MRARVLSLSIGFLNVTPAGRAGLPIERCCTPGMERAPSPPPTAASDLEDQPAQAG